MGHASKETKVCKWNFHYYVRAVGRSEKPGVPVLFGGHNFPLLVEIGLTDLPKSGHGTPRDDRPAMCGMHIRGCQLDNSPVFSKMA